MGKNGLARKLFFILITIIMMTIAAAPAPAASVSATFLYKLSDFTGVIPFQSGRVRIDQDRKETYVLYQNNVRIFNDNGMETYRFGDSQDLGRIQDLAIDRNGDILILSYREKGSDHEVVIIRCNYKGDPGEGITITGMPQDFEFRPNHMAYRDGQFYLADGIHLRVAVVDANGRVQKAIDLLPLLELVEKDRGNVELGGFSVDNHGNMLFTLPVLFFAAVLSPEGKISTFGEPGSLPGRFTVVSDIARDSRDNIFIVDQLKSVVSVYNNGYTFLNQIGGRENGSGSLISPVNLAVGDDGLLYVTQLASKGISVFRLQYN